LGEASDPMFELVFLGTAAAVPSAERGLPDQVYLSP